MEICSLFSGVLFPSNTLEYPAAVYEPAEMPFFFHGSYRMASHLAGMNQKNTYKGQSDSCIFLRFDTSLTYFTNSFLLLLVGGEASRKAIRGI